MSGTNSRGRIALVLAALLAVPFFAPGQDALYPDAVSREVSSFNFGEPSAAMEAISRELSLFNFGQSFAAVEAISREVSLFNFGQPSAEVEATSREISVFNLGQPSASFEAISREVSVLNFGEPSAVGEAISREVSVFNLGEPSSDPEAISREVSVFNFGQPAATEEAISREVSVFNVGQPSANVEAVSREVSVFNVGEFSASVEAISREVSVFNGTNELFAPLILTQPTNQIVVAGSNAVLVVEAAGTPLLSYQWLFNETNVIAGATQPILSLTNAEPVAAGNYRAVVMNSFGAITSQVATLTVASPPVITRQPASLVLLQGQQGTFSVAATGTLPMGFQWGRNGQPLITQVLNQTNASLTLFNVQPADSGLYQVIITNIANPAPGVPSDVATLTVFAPLTLGARPASTNVSVGSTATFCVDAGGTPPVLYQWRHNGANIEGATNACLSITNVQLADGGTYHVVIENVTGTLVSDDALLRIIAPPAPAGDNFVNRVSLGNGNAGLVSGTNSLATREPSEPDHARKPGGRSVWYTWTAPANGITTFRTVGSSFDTLLAVYTGTSVGALTNVASDEDGGGFFTSELQFNARAGTAYPIAIDGFEGANGEFLLSSNLEITAEVLPTVMQLPASRTVLENASASFTVTASGSGLNYQWLFNGALLSGEIGSTLRVANVRPEQVGFYAVRVGNSAGRIVQSDDAILEIGPEPEVQSQDKFGDSLLPGAAGGNVRGIRSKVAGAAGFLSLSAGLPIALVINNTNSTTERFEPSDCRIDGASRWLTMQAAENGTCVIDTIGSQVNTVLGVYTGSNYLTLQPVACDDNGAPDGVRSLVKFAATQGRQYRVRVDGVNGRQGIIRVNAKIGHAPPVDATEPTHAAVKLGDVVQLSAPLSTDPMTVYEWQRDGASLPGATAPVLEIPLLSPTDGGTYAVVRANEFGRTTNIVATLTLHLSYLEPGFAVANGNYRLVLQRPANQTLLIESSEDLTHWIPRHTVPLTTPGPTIEFPVTNSRTFFRARPWP